MLFSSAYCYHIQSQSSSPCPSCRFHTAWVWSKRALVPKIKEHLRRWGPAKLLLSLCLSSGRGCTFLAWSILQSLPMHAWGFASEAKQFPPNRNRGLPYSTAMPQAYLSGWPMKKSSTATFDYIWPSWTRLSILEVLISQGFAPALSPLA